MERRKIEIGERLREARETAGYSQEGFAEKLGCCAITVSRWENGHTPMKAMDIVRITEALGISADYLLGVEKSKHEIGDMLADLSVFNRKVVLDTLEAMVASMKSYQKC